MKGEGDGKGGLPMSDEDFDAALSNAESGCHDTVLKAIDDNRKRKESGEELDDKHTCHRVHIHKFMHFIEVPLICTLTLSGRTRGTRSGN